MILDPQPIGNGAGIGIDVGLEGGDAADQVLGGGMAVMVGDVLAQPAPKRLNCLQVRTVAGQWQQMDAQATRGGPDRLGTMIPAARISDTSAPTVLPVMATAGRTRQTMKRPVPTCQNLRRLV